MLFLRIASEDFWWRETSVHICMPNNFNYVGYINLVLVLVHRKHSIIKSLKAVWIYFVYLKALLTFSCYCLLVWNHRCGKEHAYYLMITFFHWSKQTEIWHVWNYRGISSVLSAVPCTVPGFEFSFFLLRKKNCNKLNESSICTCKIKLAIWLHFPHLIYQPS